MSDNAETAQAPVIAHFARGARRIDTQGAIVFLEGDEAIKIRRAIRLPFLDYSTLDKRKAAAEAEIALNRPYAPRIYRDAAPIRRTATASASRATARSSNGRRACAASTRPQRSTGCAPSALSADLMRKLARAIHALHEHAEPRAAEPAIAAMRAGSSRTPQPSPAGRICSPPTPPRNSTAASREALARAAPLLRERGARGWIRRCHGDLHLGNIALIDDTPTPFDAIEFDDAIATGDVLYDLAFAVMDLWERDLRPQANWLLNDWLALGGPEPYDALAALPLFLSLRAAIRAKVEANIAGHLHGASAARETQIGATLFRFRARRS